MSDEWKALLAAEEAESLEFRGAQRNAWTDYFRGLVEEYEAAVAEDRQRHAATFDELDASLNEFFDAESEELNADLEKSREWFKAELKKIYGFDNYGDYSGHHHGGYYHGHGGHNYAPYS